MDEINRIIKLLRKTFDKGAWHGPTARELLQDVTQELSVTRLPNTHSIIELVAHMTTWRTFVTRKLYGDKDFKVTEETNFPVTNDWTKVFAALEKSQEELLTAVEQFPHEKLHELVPHVDHRYTYFTLLHGIIHHDLYHLGQIALLKKTAS